MSPVCRVFMEFVVVVEGNRVTNDKSIWEGQISVRVEDVTEVLLCKGIHEQRLVSLERKCLPVG
jgi:hypothetical protein